MMEEKNGMKLNEKMRERNALRNWLNENPDAAYDEITTAKSKIEDLQKEIDTNHLNASAVGRLCP